MAGVAITRRDMSAADLRAAAKRSADAKQASRMLAIAMALDGFRSEEAARLCGMDRQTLRDWVHRYNEAGLDGLADRARSGRPASLSWVEQGKVACWGRGRRRSSPAMASCGSGAPICVTVLRPSSASPSTNAAWASCFGGWTSAISPFVPNTRNPIPKPRRLSKKLRNPGQGSARRARRRQASRSLVPG